MRIGIMLEKMAKSRNEFLNTFGARWSGKLTTKNLQKFHADWNKLMVEIQKHDIEQIKNTQDEMFRCLTVANEESKEFFIDINVLVEQYVKEMQKFVRITIKEIRKMNMVGTLKHDVETYILREWNTIKKTIDSEIRAEYQRLLEVIKAGEVNGGTFMEKWRNLTKGNDASYLNYYMVRNEYNFVKNDLKKIKKLSRDITITCVKAAKQKENLWNKSVKEIKKECATLFSAATDGIKNAYNVTQRDIIFAFIMLEDVKKLAELDKELVVKHAIPLAIEQRVEEERKAFEQQMSRIAKEEAFILQGIDRKL